MALRLPFATECFGRIAYAFNVEYLRIRALTKLSLITIQYMRGYMHPLLSQYSKDLALLSGIEEDDSSKLFEYFCNYVVTSKYYLGRFAPQDVTTQEEDASLDGVAFIIDGELITTIDDAKSAFNTHKTSLPVEVLITQIKSGEKFKKDEISNFSVGIDDFLSLDPQLPNGLFNCNAIEILKVVLENVKKIRNKMPNLRVFFCTSGVYNSEREIEGAFNIIKRNCCDVDLFNEVEVSPLGRKELIRYWRNISEKNETSLKVVDYIGIKENPEIKQAYIAIVNAKEYVKAIALDAEGKLKEEIFEENVRAYLGSDALNNTKISDTLKGDRPYLFSVLNNGVTIIANELAVQSNNKTFDLTNYQVINGCQTTNTLFENLEYLNDNIELPIKFIELNDTDIANKIVTATNSQTQIEPHAFLGLSEKARLIQHHFDMCNSTTSNEKVYFERRLNEYADKEYQTTRIYDIKELARCFIAVFCGIPHDASRYVKQVLKEKSDLVFQESDHEEAYYTAALVCYKYNTLVNGRKLNANNYNKLRWHVAMLYPWVVMGKVEDIKPNSNKISLYCKKVQKSLTNIPQFTSAIESCHEIIDSIPTPTDDQIKRGKYTNDLTNAAKEYFKTKTQ